MRLLPLHQHLLQLALYHFLIYYLQLFLQVCRKEQYLLVELRDKLQDNQQYSLDLQNLRIRRADHRCWRRQVSPFAESLDRRQQAHIVLRLRRNALAVGFLRQHRLEFVHRLGKLLDLIGLPRVVGL